MTTLIAGYEHGLGMERWWNYWNIAVGFLILLASPVAFFAGRATGFETVTTLAIVPMVAAGVAFLLAGFEVDVGIRGHSVASHRFAGIGLILAGVSLAGFFLLDSALHADPLDIVPVVNGVVLVLLGVGSLRYPSLFGAS